MATLEFTAGRLYFTAIENAVSKMKFAGHNISLWMGKGFFSRPFIITGDDEVVRHIQSWLIEINKD